MFEKKEVALKSTLKMYILVFIIKKQVRNWEVKRQIHVVAALCAELRGNAGREL